MSCLHCVTAHRWGRLWFCRRCGKQIALRRLPERGIPSAPEAGSLEADVPPAVVLDLDAARRVKQRRTY